MSMFTYLLGFKPADGTFLKMKAVLDACAKAKIDPPAEVKAFFGPDWEEGVDGHGVKVTLANGYSAMPPAVTKWKEEMCEGFEVDLSKLDPTIRVLRFYNSF